ncbi:MAG: LamG domain-containing protein, partial [Verrucomicrobia bacterium]|nr:LamG domain-containing protein [Verrucomicrobiota bacterium]
MVAWWRAETNALDAVGGNNGTPQNGAGFAPGEVGQAFSFNGTNSYVEVPDSPSLRLTNELTIEFWVQRRQFVTGDYILNKGGDWTGETLNYGVGIDRPDYNYALHFLFAGGVRSSSSISASNWHHCAVVARNGDTDPTFYVDGVQQAVTLRQGASKINLYPSSEPLYIGAQLDPITGWNYYNKAIVDELSIYNRALGAPEIQSIYNAGSAGKCPAIPTNCVPLPSGLVSWWQAEGNGSDVLGTNNATLMNGAGFATGKVGQAFSFNGVNQYVSVPDSPSLRPANLTVEGWVNFSTLSGGSRCLFQKPYGVVDSDSFGVVYYAGQLIAAITRASGVGPVLSYNWTPAVGTWHHVAYTFNNASSTQVLFVDGIAVASSAVSGPIVYDTHPFLIGADIQKGALMFFLGGLLDEAALYNRALSAVEIAAIYSAGSAGKCPPGAAPSIIAQPVSQAVVAGSSVSLAVTAAGTLPLSYQWRF